MLSSSRFGCLAALAFLAGACGRSEPPMEPQPNILWIVWDTVRADRLGLYGHTRETTPHLDRRARSARVFDAVAASCWTLPSHASMFTGLSPREHGVNGPASRLDDETDTVAELLRDAGYETWLFSANPFISDRLNLTQGFDTEEHPSDPDLVERARAAVLDRIDPANRSTPMRGQIRHRQRSGWMLKAVGHLANERFSRFLDSRPTDRPFFAFINYMEAHRERLPRRRFLERLLTADEIAHLWSIDRSQTRFQAVTFGVEASFSEAEQQAIRAAYDATLLELDELLDGVFRDLDRRGLLSSTAVVLTSDHGELLGENGSYLHQYSLHDGLVGVPLVIWAPGRLTPGREATPVSQIDLFPTVLELAGVRRATPPGLSSLLSPPRARPLVAEYVQPFESLLTKFERRDPDWDASPFRRTLESVRHGRYKLVRSSDGTVELHDLATEDGEAVNLAAAMPGRAAELSALLDAWVTVRRLPAADPESAAELTEDQREALRSLGYL